MGLAATTTTTPHPSGGEKPIGGTEQNVLVSNQVPTSKRQNQHKTGVGILPTFLAQASGPDEGGPIVVTRVLADTGAQTSMCSAALAQQLHLQIRPAETSVIGIGGSASAAGVALLRLQNMKGTFQMQVHLTVMEDLSVSCASANYHPFRKYKSMANKWPGEELADVWPQANGVDVDIIIGQDVLWLIMMGRAHLPSEAKSPQGPVFVRTKFGIVLQGFERSPEAPTARALITSLKVPGGPTVEEAREPPLDALLRKMISLENIGIGTPPETGLRASEEIAVKFLEKHLKYLKEEKKFQVRIPFNEKAPPFLNNYYNARGRFNTLMSHLDKNPKKKELYDKAMKKYLDDGHATLVEGTDEEAGEVVYLPHSGVLTVKPTGEPKLRVVFDCSVRDRNGTSLNDKMLTGPVPDADLVRILLQWRRGPFAVSADVQECFLNIKLHPADQDHFRFLWSTQGGAEPQKYKFTSLIFGSKASPWISSTALFKLLELHEHTDPELVRQVRRSIWVDDILLSFDGEEEVRASIKRLEEIFQQGSFKLAKYTASKESLLQDVREDQRLFKDTTATETKALGVTWDTKDDQLYVGRDLQPAFEGKKKNHDCKRSVARMVASVYDPLQFLLPWKVGGNLLIRDIWKHHDAEAARRKISKTAKVLWDEPLPEDLQRRVNEWKQDYTQAAEVKFPRCLRSRVKFKEQEIWGFSDASPEAFGCVIYIKTIYADSTAESRFLVARGKVNPDNRSLPRCELMGARCMSFLLEAVREFLGLDKSVKTFLFTDSQIALWWIKTRDPSRHKTFVMNQIIDIHKRTEQEQWYYVPTKENPADLLTRPHTVEELRASKLWKEGPDFVVTGELPQQPDHYTAPKDAETELRQKPEELLGLPAAINVKAPGPDHVVSQLMEKHSDFVKILRIIAWMKRAYRKGKKEHTVFAERAEFNAAMDVCVRYMQAEEFADIIKDVSQGKQLAKNCKLAALAPFLDEKGILRAMGRLDNTPSPSLPMEKIFPAIIPANSKVLEKVILYTHEAMGHAGTDTIHSTLRERWWIIRGRQTIQKYRQRCLQCRRYDGRPVSQRMAPLPPERLAVTEPAFTHLAIDGMGPVHTTNGGKKTSKTWVLVITCMVTRAINLEVLWDLTADSFIQAMRRQFADFGLAKTVRLDNLRSHVKMSNELDSLLGVNNLDKIREKFKDKAIKWSWSAVGQPSTNGVVERCVRTVKSAILKSVGRETLSREHFYTFLKEVKSTINSRPLTQLHHGSVEDNMAVTPNHLIFGHSLAALPFATDTIQDKRRQPIIKLWDERQKLTKRFRTLFQEQYIAELREYKKWKKLEEPTRVGDLCIMTEPNQKRREWPLAVVDHIISNQQDGLVRSVRLRLADKYVTRSIRSLVFLRHLDDYEPADDPGDLYGPEKVDPERDNLLRFVKEKKNVVLAACVEHSLTPTKRRKSRTAQKSATSS